MDVEIVSDYLALSRRTADLIITLVRREPEAVLILPAGQTPKGVYRLLVEAYQDGVVDFSRVTIVALDEWGGRSRSHPLSCHHMIATSFVEKVGIPPYHFHSLDGIAADPEGECARYQALLDEIGRPTLSLLGLGTNGHIALNEPADHLPITTHVVPLADQTRVRAEKEMAGQPVVSYGMTLGMPQIMAASTILLIANGPHKKTAVQAMLSGPIDTHCPASLLQLHPNALIILDEAAASA
ncbi:MAG: glucosamine-6-phosphate deaminase [Candidatus Promineifilaceae bacterium]